MFGLDLTNLNFDITNPIIFGVTFVIVGWVVTGFYAFVNQRFNMHHQLYLDIAKTKLEIHSSSGYYSKLSSSARTIHELLSESDKNYESFYYTCKFFRVYSHITGEFGGIALDSLDGEKGIAYLCEDIIDFFRKNISFESPSIMSRLANDIDNNELQYDQFKESLDKKPSIFPNFTKLMDDSDKRTELSNYSLWIHKLINFEINYAYRVWYGREERVDIDSGFKTYLSTKELNSLAHKINITGRNPISKGILKIGYWLLK